MYLCPAISYLTRFVWRFSRLSTRGRLVRILLWRFRQSFCRIGLLTLHLRHLTDRMLLARRGKQGHREENSDDTLANQRSHNPLPHLSVPPGMRKEESAAEHRHLDCGAGGLPACRILEANCFGCRTPGLCCRCDYSNEVFRRDARTPRRQDACATATESFYWDYEHERDCDNRKSTITSTNGVRREEEL